MLVGCCKENELVELAHSYQEVDSIGPEVKEHLHNEMGYIVFLDSDLMTKPI